MPLSSHGFRKCITNTSRATTLLLLTATIVTTCLWMRNDTQRIWFGTAENNSYDRRFLDISRGDIKNEGSWVSSQRRISREIRFVAFGTSITWGHGVENPETDVYPKLLSLSADNLAIRATGPAVPALCLKSMVDKANPDAVYDVVFLEFFHRTLFQSDVDSFTMTAQRIRTRYPDALIIFIRDWNLTDIGYYVESGDWVRINTWNLINGNREELHSLAYKHKFEESVQNGINWKWSPKTNERKLALDEIAASVGGYIVSLPKPHKPRFFLQYRNLFDPDGHHLSNAGHNELAKEISSLLDTLQINENPRLGAWDDAGEDVCVSWFRSGNCVLEVHGEGVQMVSWMSNGPAIYNQRKNALSFPFGGDIVINNPTMKTMDLYLDFMAEGPPPGIYPLTEIVIESRGPDQSVILSEPRYIDPTESWRVHVIKPAFINTVLPGEHIVHIRPVEYGKDQPFRITGINLSETRFRFDTPEAYSVQPEECSSLLEKKSPAATSHLGKLKLSFFADPKTTTTKHNLHEFDRTKIVNYVCNNVRLTNT
mmetsp:Transcript_23747/g.35438  ORF Transcript_23747/g.35438 Transcript_23747/m.35438 type:complete len:540 (-) Transcript_23747:170-1789(-)